MRSTAVTSESQVWRVVQEQKKRRKDKPYRRKELYRGVVYEEKNSRLGWKQPFLEKGVDMEKPTRANSERKTGRTLAKRGLMRTKAP